MRIQQVRDFILQDRPSDDLQWTAVSLFSGAGLSDLGYELAGFRFVVQVELDQKRADIGSQNFPNSQWLTLDVRDNAEDIARAYQEVESSPLDLLVATPPCQGMSTSNPSRGKRRTPRAEALEEKNRLLLEVIPVARLLKPRIIVIENVRQVLTLEVEHNGEREMTINHLHKDLSEYEVSPNVVNVADYGIPQIRKRALIIAVRKDEAWLDSLKTSGRSPTPESTHAEHQVNGTKPWVSIREWFRLWHTSRWTQRRRIQRGAPTLYISFSRTRRTAICRSARFQRIQGVAPTTTTIAQSVNDRGWRQG